jgi:hypothetical protein
MKPAPPPMQTLAPLPGGRVKGLCSVVVDMVDEEWMSMRLINSMQY